MKYWYDNAQNDQDHTGHTVEKGGVCFVGDARADSCPDQGEKDAQREKQKIGHSAKGKMRNCACECREGHDKHAGSHGGFELVAENAC